MTIRNLKPLAVAISAALAAAMPAFGADDASENPFALDEVRDGYHLFAKSHGEEGDCSGEEGDCSGDGDDKDKEGSADEEGSDEA